MSITKKFMISALTLSTAFALGISTQNVSNVNASRYHYRYARRSHLRRNWNRRCHTGYFRRGVWYRYATGHFNRSWKWVPNRRRARRYHIYYHGMNGGWTTSRRVYNANMRALKHAVKVHNRNVLREATAIHGRNTRTVRPKRPVKRYHMDYDGVDVGWTTNYNTYKKSIQWTKEAIAKREQQLAAQQNDQDQSSDTNTDNDSENQFQPAVTPKKHHSENNSVSTNLQEIKEQTLADINNDREENGESPLQESSQLDNIANVRAQQAKQNENLSGDPHIDPRTGQEYTSEDSQTLGYGNQSIAENLDGQGTGDQYTYYNTEIHNNNGYDMANNSNDAMMNHDSFCNNGHRNNILDNTSSQIGVGAAYNSSNNNYYLAEDFE